MSEDEKLKIKEAKKEAALITSALDSIDKINPYATYLSDSSLSSTVSEWTDTGNYVLNAICSGSCYGGIPGGRVTLLAGESKVGKSLFVMKILANAQKDGRVPVIFDSENALDAESAKRVGLDLENVKYIPCVTIEQTRNAIFKLLEQIQEKGLEGKFIIAIDSLGNLQSELEIKRMGKDNTATDMGSAARAIKSLLKMCTTMGGLTNTTILCTNHVYDDPSAMFPSLEKNMSGGKGTAYLPSLTVQLARKPIDARNTKNDNITGGDQLATAQKTYAGIVIRALTVKNRFIMQYLEGEMYLSFSTGLDRYYGLLDLAVGLGAIIQTGSTYTLPDGKKLGFYKSFRKDKELWEDTIIPVIEEKIKKEWTYSGKEHDVPEEDILDMEMDDEA